MRGLLAAWNIRTAAWLRYCVYDRVTAVNVKPGLMANVLTMAVSALWHGFMPGYLMSFMTGALFLEVGRKLRRCLRGLIIERCGVGGAGSACTRVARWLDSTRTRAPRC